jgi:tellurite resistance protein
MLGLLGLTLVHKKAAELLNFPVDISTVLLYLSSAVFVLILLIYLLKLIKYKKAVLKEVEHPIRINFFPTIGISFLLLSILNIDHNYQLARIFWLIGIFMQTYFSLFIISRWMHRSTFKIQHFNPSWFIPAVGNILVPVAGIHMFHKELSWFYFSIGIVLWIVLLTISFYRLFFHEKLADKLMPTIFLLIAPQAVAFISYHKLNGSLDSFARILYYFTLFVVLLLITQIRYFTKLRYYLSWWAYSFPLSAFTIATMLMFRKTGFAIFNYIANLGFLTVNLLIIVLIYQTIKYILKKEICIEE